MRQGKHRALQLPLPFRTSSIAGEFRLRVQTQARIKPDTCWAIPTGTRKRWLELKGVVKEHIPVVSHQVGAAQDREAPGYKFRNQDATIEAEQALHDAATCSADVHVGRATLKLGRNGAGGARENSIGY